MRALVEWGLEMPGLVVFGGAETVLCGGAAARAWAVV